MFEDIAVSTVIGLLSGSIGAYIGVRLGLYDYAMRLRDAETLLGKHINGEYGVSGRANRLQNEERMEMALLEVAKVVKEGKPPADAIKEVAMKYPDVALKLAKRGLSL